MKKQYKFLGLILLVAGLFSISLNAIAASKPATFVPDSAVYLQFDTTKPHPFKGQLQSLFDSAISSSTEQPVAQKIFGANLENTVVGFSQTFHLTTGKELFLMGFAMDENSLQKIIASTDPGTITKEDLGLGRIIYTADDNFFFTYKNGNIIASNEKNLIHDQLFTSTPENLSLSSDYQNFISKIDPNSFLLGYFNFDKMNLSGVTEINNWLSTQGFALSQDLNGLSGKFYANFKPTAGWDAGKYSFSPALYTRVNANNLIFYLESNNLSGRFRDFQKTLAQSDNSSELDTQKLFSIIDSNAGFSVETALEGLFQNRFALMVHSDPTNLNWTAPAISMMSEVKGQEVAAQSLLKLFQDALEKEFKAENRTYTIKDVPFGNSTLKQLSVTYLEPNYAETDSPDLPTTTYIFTLNYGVTSDGILIFSTLKNPADLISSIGLSNDAAWKSAYTGQQLTDIAIFNFDNFQTYLDKLMAGNGISQDIDKLLAPLNYFTFYTTGSGNTQWANFRINLDISKLSSYQSTLTDLFNTLGFNSEMITDRYQDAANPFNDVRDQDWFRPYVGKIYKAGIMLGYDNEFRPNQNISRAEFVKVLIEAAQYAGQDLKLAKFSENFKDVDGSAWYSSYINQARANNIVSGYQDGTFHPNAPITRAEAMKMLVNSDPLGFNSEIIISNNRPFIDVKTSDWFFSEVYRVFDAGFVNGKTFNTFSPNSNLTRAEAAKIISLKLGLN